MRTNERVVQAQVNSYNARDLERFLTFFSPDVVILDGEGNRMVNGHEGLRQRYAGLFDRSPKLHAEIKTRIAVGRYVMTEEHITGINLKGYPSELRAVEVYRIIGRKITRVQVFS
jgi:uncharacterized protein (TIGR02246 family)